jgi:hypothetical protein
MSTLFTAVSVEQQETVAGGAPAQSVNLTGFSSALNALRSASISGPGGSQTASEGVSDKRFTVGVTGVTLDSAVLPGFPTVILPVL